MSALNFAKQAFSREKPHSSITDWVDILTASGIEEEAYDGIPEIVDSINLQASGPAEASRALRKKLKHGNAHQQYRALVILKALVENCGQKFQNTFADGHMTDALKGMANDPATDKRVKKKLMYVLGAWREQYKDDPSMSVVAGLYKQCRGGEPANQRELAKLMGLSPEAQRRVEKEEEKRQAKKRAKEEARLREAEAKKKPKVKRVPFNFETDKPKVLSSIVEGSQASSNLVNAITLVNRATDSLDKNERVQECLTKAKLARKPVVRYIQLVENEEVIGTLIETNDRLMAALEMYERLSASAEDPDPESTALATAMAATSIKPPAGETFPSASPFDTVSKGKDRSAHPASPVDYVHPDLEDLNFGPLGASSNKLPAPLRPSALSDDGDDVDAGYTGGNRGSLSDFSDYESSDEETHKANAASSSKKHYVTVSDDEEEPAAPLASGSAKPKTAVEDDPFADPFADK